jgi:hypothetical protein
MNFLLEIKLRQEAARKYNPVTETKNPKLNFSSGFLLSSIVFRSGGNDAQIIYTQL